MNAPVNPTGRILVEGPMIEAPLRFRLRAGGSLATDDAFVICPKCETTAFIRRSERLTPMIKQLTAHCTNSACGHIFNAQVVVVETLVPGNLERPDLNLPVRESTKVPHVVPPRRGDSDQPTMFDDSG